MIIWEKVHRVRERKTKLQRIKLVEDVESIHFIEESDFVQVVASEELLSSDNQVGVIDIVLSMGIRDSIDKLSNIFQLFLIPILIRC